MYLNLLDGGSLWLADPSYQTAAALIILLLIGLIGLLSRPDSYRGRNLHGTQQTENR